MLLFPLQTRNSRRVRTAFFHGRLAGVVVLFLLLSAFGAQPQTEVSSSAKAADPKPSVRIDLSPLGYKIPNGMERLTEGEASGSLNFLDSTHVLLTFDSKGLFRRLPSCPPEHADRMVHAVVLDLVTGKAVKEADWYLHDRQQYVWPFGTGKLLLRKLNDL